MIEDLYIVFHISTFGAFCFHKVKKKKKEKMNSSLADNTLIQQHTLLYTLILPIYCATSLTRPR